MNIVNHLTRWNPLQAEAFALRHCGNEEPTNNTDHGTRNDERVDGVGRIRIEYNRPNNADPRSNFRPDSAIHYYSSSGRGSLLCYNAKRIFVVAFRGTYNLENQFNDADCQHVEFLENRPEVKVHNGFQREYKRLFDPTLMREVFDTLLGNPDWQILVTGHSLGAALATLCVADMLHLGNGVRINSERVSLITFGSPRVGNQAFQQWIDGHGFQKNINVKREKDIVVYHPRPTGDYYRHRGALTFITDGNVRSHDATEIGETMSSWPWAEVNGFISWGLRVVDPGANFAPHVASVFGGIQDIFSGENLGYHEKYYDYPDYHFYDDERFYGLLFLG
jgi:hypothetical protein